jgi:ABC-2 type transport system permease protein
MRTRAFLTALAAVVVALRVERCSLVRIPAGAVLASGLRDVFARALLLPGNLRLVAWREMRQTLRCQHFRYGTLLIIAAVAAAIVIPAVTGSGPAVHPAHGDGAGRGAALVALLLIFIMLSEYNAWTLSGVVQEKSARVTEVLFAATAPARLLAGKVLGIGVAVFSQASFLVLTTVIVAKVVSSSLLDGTSLVTVAATAAWLVLGYAFYSWIYAAAGAMAGHPDQVWSLVLPLQAPLVLSYLLASMMVLSGSASGFFQVLAYLPPTAPFAMPVLVSLGIVAWWQFAASALISVAAAIGMSRAAGVIYGRAIMSPGRRIRLREVLCLSHPAGCE